jgi:voltage-gated potassium channel
MLYHGSNTVAIRFQLGVILIDLAIIAFFIATPVVREWSAFLWD